MTSYMIPNIVNPKMPPALVKKIQYKSNKFPWSLLTLDNTGKHWHRRITTPKWNKTRIDACAIRKDDQTLDKFPWTPMCCFEFEYSRYSESFIELRRVIPLLDDASKVVVTWSMISLTYADIYIYIKTTHAPQSYFRLWECIQLHRWLGSRDAFIEKLWSEGLEPWLKMLSRPMWPRESNTHDETDNWQPNHT